MVSKKLLDDVDKFRSVLLSYVNQFTQERIPQDSETRTSAKPWETHHRLPEREPLRLRVFLVGNSFVADEVVP